MGGVGSSQEISINATYDSSHQTMTVTGAAGLFVETKDSNGNVIGSGVIGSEGTVTYTLNTAGQVNNAPIYTKSALSSTVSHSLVVIPSNEIPSNEMHFTTLEGSAGYVGTQGDQIFLSDGTIVDITATEETFTFDVPSGKHKVKLVESVGRSSYVSVGGEALVELHNFPALSTVTKFNFATYEYNALPNLTKVPDFLPSSIVIISYMFCNAAAFNQDISMWDTSNVTTMIGMFEGASAFNQPLNNWNVSNVTDMSYMFRYASSFNQDLSNWCVSNLPNMPEGFNDDAPLLVGANLPVWGTCPAP